MVDGTLDNGQVTNATKEEEKVLPLSPTSHSIALKALKTNAGAVWIGKQGAAKNNNGGFPLSPGEGISLDLKNSRIFVSFDSANDSLAWVVTSA